jgi:hypothetical protein
MRFQAFSADCCRGMCDCRPALHITAGRGMPFAAKNKRNASPRTLQSINLENPYAPGADNEQEIAAK